MNPFKALFVSCIIVLGNGTGRFLVLGAATGILIRGAATGLLVRGTGTGLYPSQNSNGGGIIFSS